MFSIKRFKSIVLVFTFFTFGLTSLFSFGRSWNYSSRHDYSDAVIRGAIAGAGIGALCGFKVAAAIISDKFYREDNKDFNRTFKAYLVADSVDSILRSKDFGFASDWILIYDIVSLFRKAKKNSEENVDDKVEVDVLLDNAEDVVIDSEYSDIDEEKSLLELQKFLIFIKNSLFILDGISSLSQNILKDKAMKGMWANIGNISKILARSIDTKNCKIVKKGFVVALFPTIGYVYFYKKIKNPGSKYRYTIIPEPIKVQKDFTYYDLLGVSKNADSISIKASYKKLVRRAHPDKGGSANAFKSLRSAYDCLSDVGLRKNYDNWLGRDYSIPGEKFHELMTSDAIEYFKELNKQKLLFKQK